jgi:Tfp pilus assembly protein PilX
MHLHRVQSNRQHGVALITSLIFLVILTMLGLSVVNSTTAEEKMSRNTRDADVAFAAAEAALRDAELHITGAYQWPYNGLKSTDFDTACPTACATRAWPRPSRPSTTSTSTARPVWAPTARP